MSKEYNEYITKHKNGLRNGLTWLLNHYSEALVGPDGKDYKLDIDKLVMNHDNSKFFDSEYTAYDEYFYGEGNNDDEFDLAWLHHQNRNAHHWQYWVLLKDDGNQYALEMPYEYIIEMILDWWSFSWSQGNLFEIFKWYDKNKDNMILHDSTKNTVEDILNNMENLLYSSNPVS